MTTGRAKHSSVEKPVKKRINIAAQQHMHGTGVQEGQVWREDRPCAHTGCGGTTGLEG